MKKKWRPVGDGGAIDHATGVGFRRDRSTTRAVLWRMVCMEYWLKGVELPPHEELVKRAKERGIA